MVSDELFRACYPGTRHDGTAAFYAWVRQHTRPSTILLNLGAGPTAGERTRAFKGEVARVIGADVDAVVLKNADLDEAHVIEDGLLPFSEDKFDVVLSDYVLEHVADPGLFLREVHRVLKPGASFFFRTPNKYHYVSLIARATPHWFHDLVANKARVLAAAAHDPYPTHHRMNSRRDLSRLASTAAFKAVELRMFEAQPSYLMFHTLPFLVGVAHERVVNRFDGLAWLRQNIFGRMVK